MLRPELLPLGAAGLLLAHEFVPLRNLVEFFACIGGLCVVYLACVWFLALTRAERDELKAHLPGRKAA